MDFVGKSLLAALLIVVGVAGVVGIALLVVNGWAEYSIPISLLVVAVAIVGAGGAHRVRDPSPRGRVPLNLRLPVHHRSWVRWTRLPPAHRWVVFA